MQRDARGLWRVLTATALIAGCSHGADDSAVTGPGSSVAGVPSATVPVEVSDTSSNTVSAVGDSTAGGMQVTSPPLTSPATAVPPEVVVVSGGRLPSAVVEAYASNGGDMVDPSEWERRFGFGPIPVVSGDGVVLVEALRRFEDKPTGWVRVDEASWLAVSDQDRDSLVAQVAAAAHASGEPQRSETHDPGAECVVDTYPAVNGVVWQVQGCAYEQFPQFVSVGVGRTGPTSDDPTSVDPTLPMLVDATDGRVTFTEVRLGEPGADGSTLHLSAQVATKANVEVASTLVAGPLAGWRTFPGEGSVLLSGPTGATWTISDTVAVFAWAGRW